jgi:hypothetical protein
VRLLLGTVRTFSVEAYEAGLKRAGQLSSPRAVTFHQLRWATTAPPVEALRQEWVKYGCEEFRISDWEAYAAQMDRLIGLTD